MPIYTKFVVKPFENKLLHAFKSQFAFEIHHITWNARESLATLVKLLLDDVVVEFLGD
jgi:hypothetical protein